MGDTASTSQPTLLGAAEMVRHRFAWFPSNELMQNGTPVASLGRVSSLNVFFGPGQRVRLPDGTRWTIAARGYGKWICPVVLNEVRGKLAAAAPASGGYGIFGEAFDFHLSMAGRSRSGVWILKERDRELAWFTGKPRSVIAERPIPLSAVLLAFTVIALGVPGDAEVGVPTMRW